MNADPRLFLWPKGADPKKIETIKNIVIALNLPYSVKPWWYDAATSEEAERVLVLEEGFEHGPIVSFIYPKKRELLQEAVEWALGLRQSNGARTAEDTMNRIFAFGDAMHVWDEVRLGGEWVRVGDERANEREEGA